MCDTTFAFGQRGSHYFECPSRKELTHLPPKLAALLSSAQVKQVYHVTLGFEDSYLITWRTKGGQDHIDSQGLPHELIEFLYARNAQQKFARNIANIRCSLGPYNASFFAHDGSSYRWMNLPSELLTALESRITQGNWLDQPRIVTLGANNNFVLVTEKHGAVWNLGNYQTAFQIMDYARQQENRIAEIRNVFLHAYRYDCFVTQSRNGMIVHNGLPQHALPSMQNMVPAILEDTEESQPRFLTRKESGKGDSLPQRTSNLQRRAQLRRDWDEHTHKFTAQTKGAKISLSLSVSAAGLMKLMR